MGKSKIAAGNHGKDAVTPSYGDNISVCTGVFACMGVCTLTF